VKCANCGSDAPDWAASCPNCGTPPSGPEGPHGPPPPPFGAPAQPFGGQGGAQPWAGDQPSAGDPPWGGSPGSSGWTSPGTSPWGAPPPYGDQGPGGRLAGWWTRVGATVIDGIILAIVYVILRFAGAATAYVVTTVVDFVYFTVLGLPRAQTVGNMALGTRVVDQVTGGPIGYGRAFLRYLIQFVFSILFVIPLIVDFLWPLWDRRNQTLHDKVAKSVVIGRRY